MGNQQCYAMRRYSMEETETEAMTLRVLLAPKMPETKTRMTMVLT
jgi:hypothetical protein